MRFNPITGQFELGVASAVVDGAAINPSSIGAATPATIVKANAFDASNIFPGFGTWFTSNGYVSGGYCVAGSYHGWWESSGDFINQRLYAINGAIQQRNGATAQQYQLHATWTSDTIYERLVYKYDGGLGAFVIGTEKGVSGGGARDLIIQRDGTKIFTFDANGVVIGNNIGHCSNNGGLFDVGFGALNAGYPGIRFGSSAVLFSDHLLQYGGQTSSFPALKRNGTGIDFRLADDSADAPIKASRLNLSSLPTSAAGLSAGDIWNDSGTLKIA